jgi:plasmid stabilization system protein ParE
MRQFKVRFTPGAEGDLLRLFNALLEPDPALAIRAEAALTKAVGLLEDFPFCCRKPAGAPPGPFLRDLIILFGTAGDVAMFEIELPATVTVLAVRHQREDDYH